MGGHDDHLDHMVVSTTYLQAGVALLVVNMVASNAMSRCSSTWYAGTAEGTATLTP